MDFLLFILVCLALLALITIVSQYRSYSTFTRVAKGNFHYLAPHNYCNAISKVIKQKLLKEVFGTN